jgi:hypothetical protein
MAHRFLRLTQECRKAGSASPVMLVLNNVTRQIVTRQLTQLGVPETDIDVRFVSELPKARNRLLQVLGEIGPVVIDDGQEPVWSNGKSAYRCRRGHTSAMGHVQEGRRKARNADRPALARQHGPRPAAAQTP